MLLEYATLAILIYGHLALWIGFFNRSHGYNLPGRWLRLIEVTQILSAIGLMVLIIERYLAIRPLTSQSWNWNAESTLLSAYGSVATLFAAWNTIAWSKRMISGRHPPQLIARDENLFRLGHELKPLPVRGWSTRLFAYLPTNQMFDLCVNEKVLEIPRLPEELNGLTILHLSDLHFSGKITLPFFDRVFDHAAALSTDLIAVTGDILEDVACYEWLQRTLGRLSAPHGKFFVLGNHDRRIRDLGRLRRELTELGFHDLQMQPKEFEFHGRTVQISGNELPWCGPPPEPLPRTGQTGMRILLSHSPDQLSWARDRGFDLMLAGHTHGGHIRLPLIGPIVCPSRFGVRYAGGIFYEPPTLLHVSRGISGLDPLRFNCPPEITKLVLRSPRSVSDLETTKVTENAKASNR